MRIAYLVTYADPVGGALIHVRDLATALTWQGHEIVVLAGGDGILFEELRKQGIACYSLKHLVRPIQPAQDLQAVLEIRQLLKKLKPQILSLHSSKAGLIGRLAAAGLGISVIFTAHGWAFTDGVPKRRALLYKGLEKMAAPLAKRIITVSTYDQQLALQNKVAMAEKLVVVHNGVHDIAPALQARVTSQPSRLLMVARYEQQKDHATLLQALAGLKEFEWTLDLVGGGKLQAELENLAWQLGISERVIFWGARQDVAEFMAQSQIFLLISHWEGFPRSILEAMRAGLPVIASDVGGSGEAVIDGKTGFLIARNDSNALQKRLQHLLTDPNLRRQFGEAGRQSFELNFTVDHLLEQTLNVYRSCFTYSLEHAT